MAGNVARIETALADTITRWQRTGMATKAPQKFRAMEQVYNRILAARGDIDDLAPPGALSFYSGMGGIGELGKAKRKGAGAWKINLPDVGNGGGRGRGQGRGQGRGDGSGALEREKRRTERQERKWARQDAREDKKRAHELAMQQAKNQALQYQYGYTGYGYDTTTYAYDPGNMAYNQGYIGNDPYAINAAYQEYTPAQYGVAPGDTYNETYYMPGTDDYYEDYGDYPAQLPQVTALSPGGVRPDILAPGSDIVDSVYVDIDSGGIFDELSGYNEVSAVVPPRPVLRDPTGGAKAMALVGALMLGAMYTMAGKKGR